MSGLTVGTVRAPGLSHVGRNAFEAVDSKIQTRRPQRLVQCLTTLKHTPVCASREAERQRGSLKAERQKGRKAERQKVRKSERQIKAESLQ